VFERGHPGRLFKACYSDKLFRNAFLHPEEGSGRSGSRNHNCSKLDGFLPKYGFELPLLPLVRATGRIGQKLFLPDAKDVPLLSINTVEYARRIKTGVKGTPRTINTYDFSADSEQRSL
jgi:hypothetical protein